MQMENSRLKTLEEIYKTYTPLHRYTVTNSAKLRQTTFCIFAILMSNFKLLFDLTLPLHSSPILMKLYHNFSHLYEGDQQHLLSSQISSDFATNNFENFKK